MDVLPLLLPLALSAGVNLYFTIFVVGIVSRFQLVAGLPPGTEILGSIPVIAVSGTLMLLEFFADKIPFVDSLWSFFHTVVRPTGAAAMTLGMTGDLDPSTSTSVALVAGGTAFTSHTSKMGLRALINTSPEPASNIIISTMEDSLVLGLVMFALYYPVAATVIAVIILATLIFLTPHLFRWSRFWYQAFRARFQRQITGWDTLPTKYQRTLGDNPPIALYGTLRGLGRLSGRGGYLCVDHHRVRFGYNRLFGGAGVWEFPLSQIVDAQYQRGVLMDTVDLYQRDKNEKKRRIRFVFLKNRADRARQLADLLDADTSNGTLAGFIASGGKLATDAHQRVRSQWR